jgi:hypothetical protein
MQDTIKLRSNGFFLLDKFIKLRGKEAYNNADIPEAVKIINTI